MFRYRVGFPFWKVMGRVGVPLVMRVDFMKDNDAGVFVASSKDLRGMVAEADTMDNLVLEVESSIADLMAIHIPKLPIVKPATDLRACNA